MKHFYSFFTLLIFVSTLSAQPWQRLDLDYYDPTGFPQPTVPFFDHIRGAVGDFNGDGLADFFDWTDTSSFVAVRDAGRFHWSVYPANLPVPSGSTGSWSKDLDGDGQDELVIYASGTAMAWKAVSSNPWSWQQRPELLNNLYLPSHLQQAIYDDYDGDGFLNAVCWTRPDTDRVEILHRDGNLVWHLDSVLGFSHYPTSIFDGDFDHDGRLDFAVTYGSFTIPSYDVLAGYRNTGAGVVRYDEGIAPFSGPGGDLEGNGQWEALSTDQRINSTGYSLVRTAADTSFFHVASATLIARFTGTIIGNLRLESGPLVAGYFDAQYDELGLVLDEPEIEAPVSPGWTGQDVALGCLSWCTATSGACLADLDGDGMKDILGVPAASDTDWYHQRGMIWKNTGSGTIDHFSRDSGAFFDQLHTRPFGFIRDSLFTWYSLGDVTGDRRADLACLVCPQDTIVHTCASGTQRRVLFYEMIGAISDQTFAPRPEWSDGLPEGFSEIHLADLGGDGLSELIGKLDGTWQLYSRSSGTWQLQENVLPPLSADSIAFADIDFDGDLDLIAPHEVWINNRIMSAPPPVPRPSSFALSAYPNPFNPSTVIDFSVPDKGRVVITVFNVLGQQVSVLQNGVTASGQHRVLFDGGQLPAGIYFLRLEAASHQRTLKLVLLK